MKPHQLFYPLLFILLLMHCQSDSPSAVPWAAATFVDPVPTRIILSNEGPETRNLDVDLRNYHVTLD